MSGVAEQWELRGLALLEIGPDLVVAPVLYSLLILIRYKGKW